MKKTFSKIMNMEVLLSVVFILLGIFLFIKPFIANQVIGYILGILILLMGGASILRHINNKKHLKIFRFELIFAIISFVLGIFILFNPLSLTYVLTMGLGVWLILSGAFKLSYAFDLKIHKEAYWSLAIAIAIIYVIFGTILIFNPLSVSLLISQIIGLFIIAYGGINLLETILFKNNINNIIKIVVRRKK